MRIKVTIESIEEFQEIYNNKHFLYLPEGDSLLVGFFKGLPVFLDSDMSEQILGDWLAINERQKLKGGIK